MVLRGYRDKFLAYINRDEFKNIREEIDPRDYHSLFVTLASLFSVMDYDEKPMWMYAAPIFSISCATLGGVLFLISFVHNTQILDIHLMTESGSYVLLMMYQFIVTITILINKKKYHSLFEALKDDFYYIFTRGQKYRVKFFENQKTTFKACCLSVMVMTCAATGVAVCACLGVAVTVYRLESGAQRPMPFPIWLFDYDIHASPIYEIILVTTVVLTFCYTFTYTFMVQTHIIWIRKVTCKADIIIWNLENLLVDVTVAKSKDEMDYYAALIKHRMREIVGMHQAMFSLLEDYAIVGKKCLLFEQTVAPPVLCMTAYCFVEKYEAGEMQLLLLPLFFGVFIMVFVPNYLGTHLLEKIESISDACWDIPFWTVGPVIRPYLLLIMQRSMRPLPIGAPGFAEITLSTYSTILTRAYTGFNMLRQVNFNVSK